MGRNAASYTRHTHGRTSIHDIRTGVQRAAVGVETPTGLRHVDGEQALRHQEFHYLPYKPQWDRAIPLLLAGGVVQCVAVLIAIAWVWYSYIHANLSSEQTMCVLYETVGGVHSCTT